MKVTESEVIRRGERELIDAITADLDWGLIEQIFRDKHNLAISEDVEYKKGDIVSYNVKVAYKLEFDIKARLSIMLDREGNCISVASSGNMETDDQDRRERYEEQGKDILTGDNAGSKKIYEGAVAELCKQDRCGDGEAESPGQSPEGRSKTISDAEPHIAEQMVEVD